MTQLLTVGSLDVATALIHRTRIGEFRYLGEGYSRAAYLGPDGFVYKVENGGEPDANEAEWDNYLNVKDIIPAGFAIPRMDIYYVEDDGEEVPVICAEYITGQFADEHPDAERIDDLCVYFNKVVGLNDCYSFNVIVQDDGTLCMIDLGQ